MGLQTPTGLADHRGELVAVAVRVVAVALGGAGIAGRGGGAAVRAAARVRRLARREIGLSKNPILHAGLLLASRAWEHLALATNVTTEERACFQIYSSYKKCQQSCEQVTERPRLATGP